MDDNFGKYLKKTHNARTNPMDGCREKGNLLYNFLWPTPSSNIQKQSSGEEVHTTMHMQSFWVWLLQTNNGSLDLVALDSWPWNSC